MAYLEISIALYITLAVIPTVIQTCIFISLLKQLYCDGKHSRLPHRVKCTAMTAFISSIIFTTIHPVHAINLYVTPIQWFEHDEVEFAVQSILTGSIVTAVYSIYIILLCRLYYAFQASIYQMTKCQLIMHGINITISSISIVFARIFASGYLIYPFFLLWIILLTAGFVQLLYKFNHDLYILVLSQREPHMSSSGQSAESNKLEVEQPRLLSTIRKHTILGCFMIFGYLLFIFVVVLSPVINELHTNVLGFIVAVGLYMFVMIGPLCIYLGFQQNRKLYRKCCGCCDRKCENLCRKLTQRPPSKSDHDIEISNVTSQSH